MPPLSPPPTTTQLAPCFAAGRSGATAALPPPLALIVLAISAFIASDHSKS
eukprot:CAMPEP_0171112642 /NCGR_PEP_ID=MMETSP0766_2-20121228/79836_1 /TAXON_ID=439317 /ORGANISM="Gambierdiscus australes, Strain CAWD 149" /LENGTH=50 /DNA_ID=CAMNT_0011574769 /DNA_START=381 /DNA_END=530 /DNA_ORIENTATION=-